MAGGGGNVEVAVEGGAPVSSTGFSTCPRHVQSSAASPAAGGVSARPPFPLVSFLGFALSEIEGIRVSSLPSYKPRLSGPRFSSFALRFSSFRASWPERAEKFGGGKD